MIDKQYLIFDWYSENKRNLPWRSVKDPYYIWLSEIILQQTKVDQGLPYYLKFIKCYPNVKSLAAADLESVLKLWQGLGYYSRARNLHSAAKQVMTDFGGVFPDNYDSLLSLKGVGEYTAAAVSSFAYGEAKAVVDGNVFRVLSRLFKIATPINSTKGKKEFTILANEILDKSQPGEHNQAMMELGALVCKPKSPQCEICPVQGICLAFADKTQLDYPVKEKKLKVKVRHLNYLLFLDQNNNILIRKREGQGIWEGLYDFPCVETSESVDEVKEFEGVTLKNVFLDLEVKHILTHQKLMVKFWVHHKKDTPKTNGYMAIPIGDISNFPLPQLIVRYVNESSFFKR
ncbi:A/G-specific adenine glycosylase [Putridiphycobacter roseus]|uniref:Adenine DNA glycosylase n=1 Tax=Putridiphycobacter roseus TaxID=2219161 RepID=A0A2W1NBT2_9FLAO|nr:A/G-specific adenine glycosylase [Putridiphycobacter roseus]PZE16543.1 A/G-specific adenine glycosylase [Putridiphycobacter roseus]